LELGETGTGQNKRLRDDSKYDVGAAVAVGVRVRGVDEAEHGEVARPGHREPLDTFSGTKGSSSTPPPPSVVGGRTSTGLYHTRTDPGGVEFPATTGLGRVQVAEAVPPGAHVWFECSQCRCHSRIRMEWLKSDRRPIYSK